MSKKGVGLCPHCVRTSCSVANRVRQHAHSGKNLRTCESRCWLVYRRGKYPNVYANDSNDVTACFANICIKGLLCWPLKNVELFWVQISNCPWQLLGGHHATFNGFLVFQHTNTFTSTNIHVSEVHCGSAVRFGQALPGFLIAAHHLYASLL